MRIGRHFTLISFTVRIFCFQVFRFDDFNVQDENGCLHTQMDDSCERESHASYLLFAGLAEQTPVVVRGQSEGFLRVRVQIVLALAVLGRGRADLVLDGVERLDVEQLVFFGRDAGRLLAEGDAILGRGFVVFVLLLRENGGCGRRTSG